MKKIKVNKARCGACKDIIESKNIHDFVVCKCGCFFVDGGKSYLRRGFLQKSVGGYEELSENEKEEAN